tara:strand:+ start:732 stop:893 length:162 start_codon:yes stop_codon:yes gene_type:complete
MLLVTVKTIKMEKIIWELQKVNLLESEIEKIWQLEKLAKVLNDLADLKRKNIS